jgi:tripartite-type tricarboxylate transporter receptor subunit TctC
MILSARAAIVIGFLFAVGCLPSLCAAQDYPSRPIRIIVSTPAGGPQDTLARLLAQSLGESFGKPVIVENRPGANTIIAAQTVMTAPPDGYTLLMGADATLSINPLLHSHLPYDPDGFAPIALLVTIEQQLYVSARLPVNSLREFIDYVKPHPGQFNYGSIGIGSTPHLAAERFIHGVGLDMVNVPFKGSQDLLPALADNQVQMTITTINAALPFVQNKLIKALASSGPQRAPELADVPTFAEAGLPQFDFKIWFGLMARKGTPQSIIQILADHTNKFLDSPEFRNVVAPRFQWRVAGGTPSAFADILATDREAYRHLLADSKIPPMD